MQPKVFSPVCAILCFFRLSDREKAFLHWVQPKGFSLVCDNLCFFSLSNLKKSLPHWEQENGLFPLWDKRWVFNLTDFVKYLSQKEQGNIVSIVFDIRCLISSPETVILVSSMLGRGLADTAGQGQPCTGRNVIYLGPNKCQDIGDKEKFEQHQAVLRTLSFSSIANTAKPTGRQKSLTILADSLAMQSVSRQFQFLWKTV